MEHHAGTARVGEDGVDAGVLESLNQKVTAHRGRLKSLFSRLVFFG